MTQVKVCECKTVNSVDNAFCSNCCSSLDNTAIQDQKRSDINPEELAASSTTETTATTQPVGKCSICGRGLDEQMNCPIPAHNSRPSFFLKWLELDDITTRILDNTPLFVGRIPPAESTLSQRIELKFPTVSRMHAELTIGMDGHLYVRDMGSRNGTYIDNQPVTPFKPCKLETGATISFSSKLHAVVHNEIIGDKL